MQGVCTVTLSKLEKGQFFEGLDMLTKLLEKKKQTTGAIEELGNLHIFSTHQRLEAGK